MTFLEMIHHISLITAPILTVLGLLCAKRALKRYCNI
jgi:hypothetical protein